MYNTMVRRLLYAFKKQWGGRFTYIQMIESDVDDRTGSRTFQKQILDIPAVKMPIQHIRKFIQDIGYLAANKNFTYGALNDYNSVSLLIDSYDLPSDFKVDLTGFVIHDYKRYERISMQDIAGAAYLLVARGVEGALPFAPTTEQVRSILQIQSRAAYELN